MRPSARHWLVIAAAVAGGAGCVSYPIVKPDAFAPKPKLAVVAFEADAISDAALATPIKVSRIDASYDAFRRALASSYELVPIDQIRRCQDYFKLPRPLTDTGTS